MLAQQASRVAPQEGELLKRLGREGVEHSSQLFLASALYKMEGLAPPPPPPPLANSIEGARYRDQVMKYISSAQPERFQHWLDELVPILKCIHQQGGQGEGIFDGRTRRTPEEIERMILWFFGAGEEYFRDLKQTLNRNYAEQNEMMPTQYTGDNCAWDYLKDTPLLDFEYVDRRAGLEDRTAHTMILGGSGSGKTNMLEHIIGQDLLAGDCTVVVLDSQVQMIPKLANLDIPVEEVTYLNPTWDIGLNLFDVGYQDMMNRADGETAINKAVALIRFVLEGTLTSPMTDRQRTMFDYAIQLIISIPGGNILTFVDLLKEEGHLAYEAQVKQFDPVTQEFFMRDWGSDDYKRTREAIRARLMTLLKNPTFRRLFSTTENNFRVYDELQDRRLILLDTNKPTLDREASSFLGRLYIAMIVQAAHRRFDNAREEYRPVYVVVDEAQEYFDERIAEMLEQARKANIGLILAHQTLSQIKKAGLDPATVIGNTATKIVSTTYHGDAGEMAKNMRVKSTDILELPQYTFGLYHRKQGFVPVRAPEHGLVDFEYRFDKDELRAEMEERYRSVVVGASIEPETPATAGNEPPLSADANYQQSGGVGKTNGASEPNLGDDLDLDDVRPI